MIRSGSGRPVASLAIISTLAVLLAGCETTSFSGMSGSSSPTGAQEPGVAPEMPATIRSDEIVGRWGLASYQDPKDRPRTEAMARSQCKQPYTITAGSSGGVIMHLADQATPQELRLKGSPSGGVMMHLADQRQPSELRLKGSADGKNYIGPAGPTPGDQDREIVSFDGRVLITRFIDKDAATRYGNMVYVRCSPRA